MKQIDRYSLAVAALLALSVPAGAQEEAEPAGERLSRELVLEKEFVPMVRDASKINALPQVELPQVSKSAIRYSDRATPAAPPVSLQQLPAAGYADTYPFSRHRGYADFAIGNYWNMNGRVGYRILQSDRDELSIWAEHASAAGKVRYDGEEGVSGKTMLKQLSERAYLSYKHHFRPLTLFVDGNYGYRLFNYYGRNLLTPAENEGLQRESLPLWGALQEAHRFGMRAGVLSREETEGGLRYRASVGFDRYANRLGLYYGWKGAAENHLRTDASLWGRIDRSSVVGLDVRMDNLFYERGGVENYTMVRFNPYYGRRTERLDLRLGLRADLTFDQGTILRMAPDIRAEWEFASSFFLRASLEGGKEMHTFAALADRSWYVNPSMRPVDSYRPVDARLTFRTNYFRSFWFELYGGYDVVRDDAVQSLLMSGSIGPEPYSLTRPTLTYLSMHTTDFYVGGSIKYRYREAFEATLRLQRNDWKNRSESEMPVLNRPEWVLSFEAAVKPVRNLSLMLDYRMETGRSALLVNDVAGTETFARTESLKNIHALNLKGNYRFTEWFEANLSANNLLNQRYGLYYGMPVQGFNVLAGVGFRF